MIPQHMSETNEHPTPVEIVEASRAVLGGIDLDPATCEEFNRRVGATRIHTIRDNGLAHEWRGRVFLNPPGGKYNRKLEPITKGPGISSAALWWAKLLKEYESCRVTSAIFVCFSLSVFRTAQAMQVKPPYCFPFVVPRERLAFKGDQPSHDNAIVFLPRPMFGKSQYDADCERFEKVFSDFGEVRL